MIWYRIPLDNGEVYEAHTKTLQQIVNDGFIEYINDDMVRDRIFSAAETDEQLFRFATCSTMAGFMAAANKHLWALCRQIAWDAIVKGCITEDDYDLVDGLLPT